MSLVRLDSWGTSLGGAVAHIGSDWSYLRDDDGTVLLLVIVMLDIIDPGL